MVVRKYKPEDIPEMIKIWNDIVEEGIAFPQEEGLDVKSARDFFGSQTYCGVAEDDDGSINGLYILHPNNEGRCGHIANCSYAVKKDLRGLHIGEKLVKDSIFKGIEYGFGVMQFNAVVATNIHALHLYERMGFKKLGPIPKGFHKKDGTYEDIYICIRTLSLT